MYSSGKVNTFFIFFIFFFFQKEIIKFSLVSENAKTIVFNADS